MLETFREREGERSRESERGEHRINNKWSSKQMPSHSQGEERLNVGNHSRERVRSRESERR